MKSLMKGGGLLYVQDDSTFTGVNVSFTGGTAVHTGGGITLNQGHFACKGCTFDGNTAGSADPWGGPHGGAIFNHNIYGSIVLDAPTFRNNTPAAADDCKCEGYCKENVNCSSYCNNCVGGPLKCCVCSGAGCPRCCVPPGTPPVSGAPDGIGCRGFP